MALRARSVEEYLAERPNEPEWLIDGMVPRGGLTAVLAKPKTGKSILAAQVANSLGRGLPLLGRLVVEPRRVLYVQLDAPPEDWRKMLRQTGLRGFDTLDFYDVPRHFLDSATRVAEVKAYVAARGYTYVIWDALEKLTTMDLNPVLGMQTALTRLQTIWPGPRMVIHHPRKGNGETVDSIVDAGAGSHYLAGEASALWGLSSRGRTKGTLVLGGRFLEEKRDLGRDGCPEPGPPCADKSKCPHTYLWTPTPPRAHAPAPSQFKVPAWD